MLIVALGWPHVLLGFSFFFGRVLRGEQDSRTTLLLLALATVAICVIHYRYNITGLIYLYFLFHLFRDEIFVYLQTRARHQHSSGVYAVAGVAPLILLILLVPKQQDFRQDLRRVEFAGTQVSKQRLDADSCLRRCRIRWDAISISTCTLRKRMDCVRLSRAPAPATQETTAR